MLQWLKNLWNQILKTKKIHALKKDSAKTKRKDKTEWMKFNKKFKKDATNQKKEEEKKQRERDEL